MIPIARTEKLLIQRVGNELIVYDEANKSSHSLNSMAARVYELCDGQHTIKDIAQLLEKELHISRHEEVDIRGLVWLTLEELERYQLIKEYVKQPTGVASISRRTVIKTGALVGGFAIGSMFPVVKSIVAPTPAMASSSACRRIILFCSARAENQPTREDALTMARQKCQDNKSPNANCPTSCDSPCSPFEAIETTIKQNDDETWTATALGRCGCDN